MGQFASPLEVALAFTHAWTGHDLHQASAFVGEGVIFDGPLQQSVGREPYLEGLAKLSEAVNGFELIAALGDDEKALLMYRLHTQPFGTLTCAKCLEVLDGKIVKDTLAFDSFPVRNSR